MKQLAILLFLLLPSISQAQNHISKTIAIIHSPDHRACAFFTLEGVTEADPVKPGNEWFAVPISHNGYDTIISMLLTAYSTGKPISVATTGALSCSHAGVSHIKLY